MFKAISDLIEFIYKSRKENETIIMDEFTAWVILEEILFIYVIIFFSKEGVSEYVLSLYIKESKGLIYIFY